MAAGASSPDSSRQLTLLFLLVLLPPAIALVWLGVRLLDQDRKLIAQRAIEQRDAAAEAVVRSLVQAVAEAERRVGEPVEAMRGVLGPT